MATPEICMHQIRNAGRRFSVDVLDLMKERRSIRKYQDRQIDREDLEKIIEAGLILHVLTGVNLQEGMFPPNSQAALMTRQ